MFTVNYVGNHGYRELVNNGGLNAYGFGSLPAAPTNPNLGTVSEVGNQGSSNFNGLTTQLQLRSKYATLQFNYTYGHALDIISNGGLAGYNYGTAGGPLNPQNPFRIRFASCELRKRRLRCPAQLHGELHPGRALLSRPQAGG